VNRSKSPNKALTPSRGKEPPSRSALPFSFALLLPRPRRLFPTPPQCRHLPGLSLTVSRYTLAFSHETRLSNSSIPIYKRIISFIRTGFFLFTLQEQRLYLKRRTIPFIFLQKEGSPFFMFSPETCFGCTDWNLIPEGVSYETVVQNAYGFPCGCPFHHIFLCGIRGGPGQTPHRMA
jgi:hypothetical protein